MISPTSGSAAVLRWPRVHRRLRTAEQISAIQRQLFSARSPSSRIRELPLRLDGLSRKRNERSCLTGLWSTS